MLQPTDATLAYDLMTGSWFVPYSSDCMGGSNKVCRIRKKKNMLHLVVELPFWVGQAGFLEVAPLNFAHKKNIGVIRRHLPFKFRSNLILNAMQPSILSLHCYGASKSIHINGIHRAHLKPGCSISLRDQWVITRILSLSRAINLEASSRLTLFFFKTLPGQLT